MVVGLPWDKWADRTHELSVSHVPSGFRTASDTSSASGAHVRAKGSGSDRLTIMKKRVQGSSRILPNARCWKVDHIVTSDFHLNLNPSCDFGGCRTHWMFRSWLSVKVAFCFGSGGLMSLASGFVLPKDQPSAVLSFGLLGYALHCSRCKT